MYHLFVQYLLWFLYLNLMDFDVDMFDVHCDPDNPVHTDELAPFHITCNISGPATILNLY